MSQNNFHNLADLCPGSYNWNIKIRIIRSWRGISSKGDAFKGLNILMLDDKDCRMHGFVPGNIIHKHEDKVLEGNVCSITNFSVKDYKSEEKFRCINSETQIIFTTYTQVHKIHEDDVLIAKNMFDFHDLGDLLEIANQNVYLTDVIAVIEKDLPLTNLVNKFGQQQTQIKFTIVDGRTSSNVTFWDSLAEEFEAALKNATVYPIIIIIASAKITSWQGSNHSTPQVEISNVTATKFYMNYDYHAVVNLRKMLRKPMFSKYDFTTQAPETFETLSIGEIRNLGSNYIEMEVICNVRVTSVLESMYWNFYQCSSCYKIIEPVKGLFKCYRCSDRIVPHPYKNWRFSVEAEDNSGRIEIELMDREARTVLGIYAPIENEEDEKKIPSIVKCLENKYYTMKLRIQRLNVEQKSFTYEATGIFENTFDVNNTLPTEGEASKQSLTQTSDSAYHLDDFSQLKFETPDVNMKKSRKKTAGKKN